MHAQKVAGSCHRLICTVIDFFSDGLTWFQGVHVGQTMLTNDWSIMITDLSLRTIVINDWLLRTMLISDLVLGSHRDQ